MKQGKLKMKYGISLKVVALFLLFFMSLREVIESWLPLWDMRQ